MEEIWKEYKVYSKSKAGKSFIITDVEFSNLGNVRGKLWNRKKFSEKLIKITKDGRKKLGQHCIYVYIDKVFRGDLPKGYVVHHKDLNKMNDCLNNLERITVNEHMKIHSTGEKRKRTKKWNWYNNGKENIQVIEGDKIPNGFIRGRIINIKYERTLEIRNKISKAKKGVKLSDERKKQMSKNSEGRHWYNDGKNNRFCYTCPLGFKPGMINKHKNNKNK